MGARSDIMAGRAYVELYVKNSLFFKGLAQAKKDVQDFGAGIMRIGGFLTAAGAGVLAPLGLMVAHFAEFGSVLNDTSERTGRAASDLAELAYAAEQTGSSLENVEKAIRFQQKSGSTETFEQAAERIAAITDPALKTAAAIKTWGKAGATLVPMLKDLKELRAEAVALGRPTDEEAKLADELGDAFGRMTTIAKNAAFAIGGALAPTILDTGETVEQVAGFVLDWVRQNGELIRTVAKVAAGVSAAGLAIVAVGGMVYALGAAFGIAGSLASAFAVVLGVVMSPVVLWTAALGVLLYKTKALGTLWTWLGNTLAPVGARANEVFAAMQADFDTAWRGIQDAIAAGDLGLAVEVAWAALRVTWQQGTNALSDMWHAMTDDLVKGWYEAQNKIAEGTIKGGAELKRIWYGIRAGLDDIFDEIYRAGAKALIDLEPPADDPDERTKQRERAEQRKKDIDDTVALSKKLTDEQLTKDLAANEKTKEAALTTLKEDADRRRAARQADHDAAVAARQSELNTARAELEYAQKKAAEAARLGAGPKRGDLPGLGLPDVAARASKASAVTFSAVGAVALGQGGGRDPVVTELKAQRAIQAKMLREAEKQRERLEKFEEAMRLT